MSNQLPNASLSGPDSSPAWNSSSPTATEGLLPSPAGLPTSLPAVNPWDVVLCVTGTLMACENGVVIALIVYTPGLRAPMFALIGSLASADLLAGLGLVVGFSVAYLLDSDLATLLSAGLLITAFSASILNILAITVDRYLSLYNALTYHTERTVICTYVILVLIWITSLALGSLPVLGWNCLPDRASCSIVRPVDKNNAAALAVTFLLVLALVLQLYLQICKIAFRHAQQIAVQHQFMTAAGHASSTTKGVSTLSAILGTFALCWVPFALYSLVADARYPAVYTYLTALPAICHSAINPVIYAFRNPDIQKSLRAACCWCAPHGLSMRPRTPSDV